MKRLSLIIFLAIILAMPGPGSFRSKTDFLTAGVAVNATVTKVNGTDFTSIPIDLTWPPGAPSVGSIVVTFTRAAGSASLVYFEFQASYDGGTTWTTSYWTRIEVPTNETAVANVVRAREPVELHGISHIRLFQIVNNDGANNLTACNATFSY